MKRLRIIFALCLSISLVFAQTSEEFQKEGERLMNSGDNEGALAQFKQAIASDTTTQGNSLLYSYAGLCAKSINNEEAAKGYFESSVTRGIKEPLVFNMLYSIYQKEKNYEGQEKSCLTAISLFPDLEAEYNNKLCFVYYNSKQYTKLDPVAEKILKTDSANSKILQFYAVSKQRQGKTNEALNLFNKLYSIDKENLVANQFLGDYYYQTGKSKIDKVKADYDKLKNPDRVVWTDMQKNLRALSQEYFTKAMGHMEFVQKTQPSENVKNIIDTMTKSLYDK